MNQNLFVELDFAEDTFELTRYILTSEIRLDLLLNIYDGPNVLEELRVELNKKPGNLLRSLNELIDKKLVVKYDKSYSLSSTGYLLAINILNLFSNWNSVNNHSDFWQKHSINSFTAQFIKRIHLWENAELIESNRIEFDKTFRVYFENLSEAREINVVLPIFSKMYMDIMLKSLIRNDSAMTLITYESILDLIRENDSDNVFRSLVRENKIDIILTDYDLELFFTSCDNFASLFLFFDRMQFDDSEMLLIKDECHIKDAKNMFSYLKRVFREE
jgi:predicted transcriptional regulator